MPQSPKACKNLTQSLFVNLNIRTLTRFIDAQKDSYVIAPGEIKNGRKISHWMWYIFPQIQGLGFSETSRYYAIMISAERKPF